MALGDKLGQCGTGVAEYVATLTNCLTSPLSRQPGQTVGLGPCPGQRGSGGGQRGARCGWGRQLLTKEAAATSRAECHLGGGTGLSQQVR